MHCYRGKQETWILKKHKNLAESIDPDLSIIWSGNPPKATGMINNIELKTQVAIHVCYRAVFDAPVSISSLREWIGFSNGNGKQLEQAVDQLVDEGHLDRRNGYLCIAGKSAIISRQEKKSLITKRILTRGLPVLRLMARLPFIRFIGISGSVAAENPTRDLKGVNAGHLDLDVFVITSSNTMWIAYLPHRILVNLKRALFKRHFFCVNYITDENFLEIHNKNFYTATELNNLISVCDKGILTRLKEINSWYSRYYPISTAPRNGFALNGSKVQVRRSGFLKSILWLPNIVSYVIFCVGRAIKRLDFRLIKEITLNFNPNQRSNLHRISNARGGYQELIKIRFEEIMLEHFRGYHSPELMEHLFPSESLFGLDRTDLDDSDMIDLFTKYSATKSNEKSTI